MNNVRTIVIGFMLGGGFGAKIGALIPVLTTQYDWSWISMGLIIGGILGIVISFGIVLVNDGVPQKRRVHIRHSGVNMKRFA